MNIRIARANKTHQITRRCPTKFIDWSEAMSTTRILRYKRKFNKERPKPARAPLLLATVLMIQYPMKKPIQLKSKDNQNDDQNIQSNSAMLLGGSRDKSCQIQITNLLKTNQTY